MLGKKITVTVAQPEVQLAGEGRKVLYKGSVALGDHSSPKPVYLISYGDPKPEQPATVIAVVSSKGKEQFVAAPENITRRRSDPSLKRPRAGPRKGFPACMKNPAARWSTGWRAGRSAFWW